MRRGIVGRVAAGVGLLGGAGVAWGIAGGQVAAAGSWNGVGMQSIKFDAGTKVATGTLIDEWHLLTAAHVFFNEGKMAGVEAVTVTFPEMAGKSWKASGVALYPLYDPAVEGVRDIAVVTLASPVVGGKVWGYNSGEIEDETKLGVSFIVGYGLSEGTNAKGSGTQKGTTGVKREAINQVDAIGDGRTRRWDGTPGGGNRLRFLEHTLIFDYDATVLENSTKMPNPHEMDGTNGRIGPLEGDSAPGDSGGPLFQYDHGSERWIVAGVASYGSDAGPADTTPVGGSRYGDFGVYMRVQDFAWFIEAAVPEPSIVGVGLILGVRVMGRRRR